MTTLGRTETVKDSYGAEYTVPTGPGMNYYWTDNAGNIVPTELDMQPDVGFTRMEAVR